MAKHSDNGSTSPNPADVTSGTTSGSPGGRKRILWVGGSKGGVGKSMVTSALIDFHLSRGEKVVLVESDTSNPDVYKSYKDLVHKTELIDFDEADGWIHFINMCDATGDCTVIVNGAARDNRSVEKFGATLQGSLAELHREFVVLWVINRQRDSLELLRQFCDAVPGAVVHVIRNGYFGPEAKFELYNRSKTREAVEVRGGLSVTFPDLADRVADELYSKRLAISEAAKELPLGNRAELTRWKGEVTSVLAALMRLGHQAGRSSATFG